MPEFNQLKIPVGSETMSVEKWNEMADKLQILNRMAILDGKLGIDTFDPKESLQIGDRWTFHSGGAKFIGYNNYWDGSVHRRLVDGHASELRFERNGDLVIRMGDDSGPAEQQISFRPASGTIFKNDGKVGIGTWSPGNKLTVHDEGDMSQGGLNPSKWQAEIGTPAKGKLLLGSFDNQPAIQGHGTETSFRLLLNPAGGNVGIGTRNPTEKLHVIGEVFAVNLRSSSHTVVGKNLTVNGKFETKEPLIMLKEYSFRLPTDLLTGKDTGVKVSEWEAGVVGFDTGEMDINEHGSGTFLKVFMEKRNGNWLIKPQVRYHNNAPEWKVKVIFISKNIVG